MSNNRTEISRKLTELQQAYESLDRFFYSNFKIQSENSKSFLKAKPHACWDYSRRIDSVKEKISNLRKLCNNHTGGWFDSREKKELDKINIETLSQIEKDVNKLIAFYKSYDVKE